MVRIFAVIAGVCLLAACSQSQVDHANKTISALCEKDAQLQPILVPVAVSVAPKLADAAVIDESVHAAIVAACKAHDAKPVGVVAGDAVAPPVAATP